MAGNFLKELKRRNVFRIALAYLAIAWLILQVADTVGPRMGMTDEHFLGLVALLATGFLIAVILAWFYEWTPEGVMSTEDADAAGFSHPATSRRYIDFVIIGLLAIAVIWLLVRPPAFPDDKTLAVLPFDNLSSEVDQTWLSNGITEEILNSLARIPELLVLGRNTTWPVQDRIDSLTDIAAELGVNYLLQGSVRRSGESLRVTYRLIRKDGVQIHSDNINKQMGDVLRIQEEVAEQVAEALDIVLDDEKRAEMFALGTTDVEAYEHFLHGRDLLYQWYGDDQLETILGALEWFEKALEADPKFAMAYSLRANVVLRYIDMVIPTLRKTNDAGEELSREEALDLYREDHDSVVEYSRDAALRNVSQFMLILTSNDYRSLRSIAENFDPATAAALPDVFDIDLVISMLLMLGQIDKAEEFSEIRIRRNPHDYLAYNHAYGPAMLVGDTERAMDLLETGRKYAGTGSFTEHNMLMVMVLSGDVQGAIRMAENPEWGIPVWRKPTRAFVFAIAGRTEVAQALIDELNQEDPQNPMLAVAKFANCDSDSAERYFRTLDQGRFGNMYFTYMFKEFGGRFGFDLAWAPNFSKRADEAGMIFDKIELRSPHC